MRDLGDLPLKPMTFGEISGLLKDTFSEWRADNASRLGAALAFYSLFSMAPLLIIVISIAGLVFGQEAAQGRVVAELQGLVGQDAARSIESIIENARSPASSIIAALAGILALLAGAAGVFGQLQDALNIIWEAPPRPARTVLKLIQDRFLSFTMLLGTGFLLLVSLIASAALAAMNDSLARLMAISTSVLQVVNIIVSFAVVTLMFAMIFKLLPDVQIAWADVWIGAAATALLFTIGKFLIGLYLGKSSTASTYGAAGSLVTVLLWVYYSAQILFLGAEFTQVYARRCGSRTSVVEQQSTLSQAV
jgi:membrane protein